MLRPWIVFLPLPLIVAACGYVSEYEEHVYDWEPVYCYQSLGGVQCHDEPKHRDARRLVNYYGPDPSRYDAPEKAEAPDPVPPKAVNHWVKDAEPVPQSSEDEQRKFKPLPGGTL